MSHRTNETIDAIVENCSFQDDWSLEIWECAKHAFDIYDIHDANEIDIFLVESFLRTKGGSENLVIEAQSVIRAVVRMYEYGLLSKIKEN